MPSLKDLSPHTLRELYGSRVVGGRVVMTKEQAGQTYQLTKKALAREVADPWAEAAARVMAEEREETGRAPSPPPQLQSLPNPVIRDAALLAKIRADRSGNAWRQYPDGRREPVHASQIDDLDYAESDPDETEEQPSNHEVEYALTFSVVVHGDDDGTFIAPTPTQLRRALMACVAELNRGGDSAWRAEFHGSEQNDWETGQEVTTGYAGCPTTLLEPEDLQP